MAGVEAAASLFEPTDSTSDPFGAIEGSDEARDDVDGHAGHTQPSSEAAQLFAGSGPDEYNSDPYGIHPSWNMSDGAFTEYGHAPQEYMQDNNATHAGYHQSGYTTHTDAQWTHAGHTGSLLV
jgi:hypothetical protein